jgi:hypothetical protein
MSSAGQEKFKGGEKARFPLLLLVGIVMAGVVIAFAWSQERDYGLALVLLLVVCVVAALGFRLIAGGGRSRGAGGGQGNADADATDNVPKQTARSDRPLGDTPEAHDEISPHDLPLDNPGRPAAEAQAGAPGSDPDEGTTRGTSGTSVAE